MGKKFVKNPSKNSSNYIKSDLDVNNLKEKVSEFLQDYLSSQFCDNIAQVVANKFKDYNIDWCPEEFNGSNPIFVNMNKAISGIVKSTLNILFANAPATVVSSKVTSAQYPDGTEYDPEDYEGGYTEWEKIVSKPVRDSDGFMTEYTMWFNNFDGRYVFTFGDSDIYYPENSDFDWECEDYDEAVEWWNDYNGFEDDDEDNVEECSKITSSSYYDSSYQWTATDVVRNMYNSFPEVDFIDERDHGDDVYLYFKYTSKLSGDKLNSLLSYLEGSGLKYHVNNGHLLIIAPEDENYEEPGDYEEWGDSPVDECTNIKSSEEFFDKGEDGQYWYFTTHGVMPGSVPKGLEILDIVDKPEGSYFLTNKVLTTDSLKYYDIKERAPKGVTSCKQPVNAWFVGDPDPTGRLEGEARYRMNKPIDWDKLEDIIDVYNTSSPVSGDWSTEAIHEMNAIAKGLDIPKSRAKKIMIEELGFDEDMFNE